MSKPILIACDGSSLRKPDGSVGGAIGWAWAREDGHWASGAHFKGSNQRAELLAILTVLTFHTRGALHIQSDSRYALDVTSNWSKGWARRGWKKADGTDVLNQDIIRPIYDIVTTREDPIEYQWVKGHRKDNAYPLNTEADLRAGEASQRAKSAKDEMDSPFLYRDSKGRTSFEPMTKLLAMIAASPYKADT